MNHFGACLAWPDLLGVFNIRGDDGVVSRLEGLDIDAWDGNTVVSKLKSPSNVGFFLSGGAVSSTVGAFHGVCDTFGEITGWIGGSEAMRFLGSVSWGDVVVMSFKTIVGVKVGAALRIRMSLSIVSFDGGSCTGTYFHKNFLFRSVTLLNPSTLTM